MSKLLERNMELEFEEEHDELVSEKAIMRRAAYDEYKAEQRLKRDKNRDWSTEEGEYY